MTGSERFFDDFKKMIFWSTFSIFFLENLQKSIKSCVFDTNGPRKRDFHEETIAIDTGETDFQCTGTNFMTFFQFLLSNFVWLKFVLSVGGSGLVVAKLLYGTFSKIDPLKIVRMVKNVKMMLTNSAHFCDRGHPHRQK